MIEVDNPVYSFNEVLCHIDLKRYFVEEDHKTGRPPYDREKLLKVVLFAFMEEGYEQFRWYAAFHDEGEHPHVHMVCYSADGKSGFLTKRGIADIKSMLAKEIFQQDLIAIYQRQTQRRDELTEDAEEVMRRLVSEMQSGTLENQRIEQLMMELSKRLKKSSGKKQ